VNILVATEQRGCSILLRLSLGTCWSLAGHNAASRSGSSGRGSRRFWRIWFWRRWQGPRVPFDREDPGAVHLLLPMNAFWTCASATSCSGSVKI